ncbi:MAG: M14 family metallopeptidase [Aquabacterium sp.]
MTDPAAGFSHSYSEARARFLAACDRAAVPVQSHPHPLPGRDGEPLAMDVARYGAADARAVLILSSACHGVEGYCGSGAQVALLSDGALHAAADKACVALLYIHALNPYGFSWWRRVTQENVDLNRNFQDFSRPLPANTAYAEIAPLLLPPAWPPGPDIVQATERFLAERGMKAFQAAVTAGQYDHPQGLFFGGQAPTWSNTTLRTVLRDHGQRCARLGWIDFHTGLGPSGHGERIFAGDDDPVALARTKAWWGSEVTSIYDGSSTSAKLTGLMWMSTATECPQATYTGIAMEYGTVPTTEVIEAMRGEQWLQLHPDAPAAQAQAIKRRMRDAFYTDTPEWKRAIVEQAQAAALQGVAGLAAG